MLKYWKRAICRKVNIIEVPRAIRNTAEKAKLKIRAKFWLIPPWIATTTEIMIEVRIKTPNIIQATAEIIDIILAVLSFITIPIKPNRPKIAAVTKKIQNRYSVLIKK